MTAEPSVSPPKKPGSEIQNKEKSFSVTDLFYNDLEQQELQFKQSNEEVNDVHNAVIEIVRRILDYSYEFHPRFKCSDIISVGSFPEGSKIIEPNEFDFLAVMDELSKPGVVEVKRMCSTRRGFAHIIVHDGEQKDIWKEYLEEGQMRSYPGPDLQTEIRSAFGLGEPILWAFKKRESDGVLKIFKATGELGWHGVECTSGPNSVINMLWTNKLGEKMRINADITPSVRRSDICKILLPEDCLNQRNYSELRNTGSYHLVPGRTISRKNECENRCFQLSFTETEVELVRKLHPIHIKSYRIMKYIFVHCSKISGGPVYRGLSSYMIKSAIVHHSYRCCQPISAANCIDKVVDILFNSLMEDEPYLPNMPSIFLKDHNLFDVFTGYQTSRHSSKGIIRYIHSLLALHIFQHEINKMNAADYTFEKGMRVLNIYHQQFNIVHQHIEERAEELSGENNGWNMPISTKELMKKFGVPYIKFKEKE